MINSLIPSLANSGAIISLDRDTLLIGYDTSQKSQHIHQLDLKNPIFYFPDFFLLNSKPWIQYSQWCEIKVNDFKLELEKFNEEVPKLQWSNSPHQELFYQSFKDLQEGFVHSGLTKAVPYVFVYCHEQMTSIRLRNSLKKALNYIQDYPGYLYGMWDKREGILGVTPEILFTSQSNILRTVALAGTANKQRCPDLFKSDPKELREHQLVVDGIRTSLEQFGAVKIGHLQVLFLPTLNHLMTPIEVQLSHSTTFKSLIKALHPTPALGAFPKEEGAIWLKKYDKPIKRGRYGAPAGCFYPQKKLTHCVVSIRNVQWNTQKLRIGAGCGVVKESQYEKEWDEINLKIQAICQMLSL